MNKNVALIITSIAGPTHPILGDYAQHCQTKGIPFIVIGDVPSPADFRLPGCDFYGLPRQQELEFSLARQLPLRHYARKNLGYLLAIKKYHSEIIIETDDDNCARAAFWDDRHPQVRAIQMDQNGWTNIYGYFTDKRIWPRGFALEHLQDPLRPLDQFPTATVHCPIQQGLADENPDVDAIYRLILPLPVSFAQNDSIAIGPKTWCPFNSQNTTWFPEAFPLLYLPSFCSFRMTDIWRSFIAHRIAYENGWRLLFHPATVYQDRNPHPLIKDFKDEVPGYLNNQRLVKLLEELPLRPGPTAIPDNLIRCYETLISADLFPAKELDLVRAWLADLQ